MCRSELRVLSSPGVHLAFFRLLELSFIICLVYIRPFYSFAS